MGFTVFLSYSTNPEDQSIVWRLQTLAAAHGIQVYVPSRASFHFPSSPRRAFLWAEVRRQIDRSDCVLAIITGKTDTAVEKELAYAQGKGKIIIPIVQKGLEGHAFFKQFPQVFSISPWESPGKVEAGVVSFLRQQKLSKDNRQAVGALVAIGVGLLLLTGLSKE